MNFGLPRLAPFGGKALGGFGALVFQGLASSALDLVLLGVLPVLALAIVVDAVLAALSVRP